MKTRIAILIFLGLAVVAVIFLARVPAEREALIPQLARPSRAQSAAEKRREQIEIDSVAHPRLAETEYRAFVQANRGSKDASVQEEVGKARIGIAYIEAGRKDYQDARETLLTAAQD